MDMPPTGPPSPSGTGGSPSAPGSSEQRPSALAPLPLILHLLASFSFLLYPSLTWALWLRVPRPRLLVSPLASVLLESRAGGRQAGVAPREVRPCGQEQSDQGRDKEGTWGLERAGLWASVTKASLPGGCCPPSFVPVFMSCWKTLTSTGAGRGEDPGVSWATSMCSVATEDRRTQRMVTGGAMRPAGARPAEWT